MVPSIIVFFSLIILEGFLLLIAQIGNQVFPHPLSEEEEKKYLAQMFQGDKKAENTLVERNLRLVAHIVKKFENTSEEFEDLISIGTIGLMKAIKTYDPNKRTKLATYAARCIENEILMHLRSIKKQKGEVYLFDTIGSDKEGNEISLMDILSSEEEVSEEVEHICEEENLRDKLKELTPREKIVLEMRYGLKNGIRYTQRVIAKRLKISRSYVSRIEKKALEKLAKMFENNGYQG